MGPVTIVGTLPEEIGTSGTARTYLQGRKKVLFFNYSNAQNMNDRHMIEKF